MIVVAITMMKHQPPSRRFAGVFEKDIMTTAALTRLARPITGSSEPTVRSCFSRIDES